ncbi:hypothetical protein ACJVDH_09905 [Pedobacter sp. AW1-32]|uniref:hypothetical protein n=1 Tax=Pedobacter sp. AW1-32 TaxID=3383026 RepID=UPI003FF0D4B5
MLLDNESLEGYRAGIFAQFTDVKRRLFLKERTENNLIPDQYYHLLTEKGFTGIGSLAEVLTKGIFNLADEHLLLDSARVHVRAPQTNGWQKLITYMPPLLLQSALLAVKAPLATLDSASIQGYYKKFLLPNFRYTALPYPFIAHLEDYIKQKKGFFDLHVHLNGATETDISWQDYLHEPEKIYHELKKAYHAQPKVREQLEQESSLLDPGKFLHLLKIGQRIRLLLFDFVFGLNASEYRRFTAEQLLQQILRPAAASRFATSAKNPFEDLVPGRSSGFTMSIEALMHILVLRQLRIKPGKVLSACYHFYLLILGLTNRLLVQQMHQYGFEQFQKHTLNGLREHSEKKFKQRFFQMHGNELRNISFLEGRISPKETYLEMLSQITEISTGWKSLRQHIATQLRLERRTGAGDTTLTLPTLKLIAHFIKRADTSRTKLFRHEDLRINIWKRAMALAYLFNNYPNYEGIPLVGADAAANEFDTPPEVFAPVFRLLRRNGLKHFTYHAGEDFYHILSGVRAVYEAVTFTGLEQGDRIGHATATGISPEHWFSVLGPRLLIRGGEWLDNLIFSYHLILSERIGPLQHLLPNLASEIQKRYQQLYGHYAGIKAIEDAWMARKFCPILALSPNVHDARLRSVFDAREWDDIQSARLDRDCLLVLERYHNPQFRQKYQQPIEIDTFEIFGARELEYLQKGVLKVMHKKEVVIETLPTSNVRIGHYADYSKYHLWNWLKLEQQGEPVPPIVLGTDDTGIFATNILNEYANVYAQLTFGAGLSHHKAMEVVKQLNRNGKIYAFR